MKEHSLECRKPHEPHSCDGYHIQFSQITLEELDIWTKPEHAALNRQRMAYLAQSPDNQHGQPYRQRELIPQLPDVTPQMGTYNPLCHWCQTPVTGPHAAQNRRHAIWHKGCLDAYDASRGRTRSTAKKKLGQPLIPPAHCAGCSEPYHPSFHVDHRLALSVAAAASCERCLIAAYRIDNSQWLCQNCHRCKTPRDRAYRALCKRVNHGQLPLTISDASRLSNGQPVCPCAHPKSPDQIIRRT